MDTLSSQNPQISPWQGIINDLLSMGAQSSIIKDLYDPSFSPNGNPFFPLESFQWKRNQKLIDLYHVSEEFPNLMMLDVNNI
jgi:hypothetical protein